MASDDGAAGEGCIYVPSSALPHEDTYTRVADIVVQGETFAVRRRDRDGSHHYDWLSGPNAGYGFSAFGGVAPVSHERHVAAIEDFLAGVDPATGYLSYP